MKRAKLAAMLRKEYVQTVILVIIMVVGVVAFWFGLRFAFRTEHPLLAVASGSMRPTLEVGDLILIRGVHNACQIYAAPKDANPPGDIIVFHRPGDPKGELIVHRAVRRINGTDGSCILKTQGDAVGFEDGWQVTDSDLVGVYTGAKVPLLGHIALFFEPLPVKVAFIMLWIILLIILELIP
ncbi:MAG: signal peptidase I, partial [Candidatus Bathyarchaeaceae archaeon]